MTDTLRFCGNDMLILVAYDVETSTPSGKKRLNKVAKICKNYGQRVQNSVFECNIDSAAYVLFKSELLSVINEKTDNLRLYNLGNNYFAKIEQFGIKNELDIDGDLIL